MSVDSELVAQIFTWEGASTLGWEVATRCDCWSEDSHQPAWGHQACGGFGVLYAAPVTITGLFRSQGRWVTPHSMGEFDHGEAQLTTPLSAKPHYTDRRVRDRFTVVPASDDETEGRVFYPAGPPSPFLFGNEHLAWRVQLQSLEQRDRVVEQP